MGALLLAAGTRTALLPAEFPGDDPPADGRLPGQRADVEIHAKEIFTCDRAWNEIMAKHTGQTVERISARHRPRQLPFGGRSVKFGIVDKVLTSRAEAAAAAAA